MGAPFMLPFAPERIRDASLGCSERNEVGSFVPARCKVAVTAVWKSRYSSRFGPFPFVKAWNRFASVGRAPTT